MAGIWPRFLGKPGDPSGNMALLRRLLKEDGRRHAPSYALALGLMALMGAATAGSAWLMRDVINKIFIEKNERMVWVIAGTVIGLYAVKGFAAYGQAVVLSRVGNDIVAGKQKALYRHILAQGLEFFDSAAFGDLMTRITHNAAAARDVLNLIAVSFGRDLFTLVSLLAVVVAMDPLMALLCFTVAGPAVWGLSLLVRRLRRLAQAEVLSLAAIMSLMRQSLTGTRVIKAFGAEGAMTARMDRAIDNVRDRADGIAALQARASPLMEALGGFAVAAAILWGGMRVIRHGADPGSFFAFITALLMAYEPAKRLARMHLSLEVGLLGVRMMYELLDRPSRLTDAPEAKPLAVTRGEVVFEDVSFSYGPGRAAALDGLSFTAEAGRKTALVGLSGSGKSTALQLVERFYDPDKGRILIDGQDIRLVTLESLRQSLAIVTQDTFLFGGGPGENIRVGRPEATQAEIEQAARDANAHDFINALEGGYEADLGEEGGKLSGGQRQRLAIARAMLRGAPILLLDEATSALDAESEEKIQIALRRLMAGRTALVIAHRLSTVRDADKIVVFEAGRVVEEGDHAALIAKGGVYARLHALQFKS